MGMIIEFFRQLVRTLRFFGLLMVNKGEYKDKVIRRLRWDYLRLKLVSGLFSKRREVSTSEFELLNFQWRFFDVSTFISLVEEIFIENGYRTKINSKKPFIIDLGSNIGLSVLYFKTVFPSSKILAFEPDPITFDCLKGNVVRAKFKNIDLVNAAVYDRNGEVSFYVDKDGAGSPLMSTVKERLPKEKITVKSVRLSQLINQKVDILKMDIEGAELRVMKDLDKYKKIGSISQMFIEYHHHIDGDVDEMSEMLAILEKNNFGYQISSGLKPPYTMEVYEDIHIFAYNKSHDQI